MLKKLIAAGVFCAVFMTQALMGVADAAPEMAPKESVVQEAAAPEAAAGSVMQSKGYTYVYRSTSTKSSKVLPLGPGNLVRVKKDCGSWVKVDAAGKVGYVIESRLKAQKSATPKSASSGTTYKAGKVVQATKFTYVYKTASTSGKKLLPLGAGNKMDVLKDCGSWIRVKAAGKTGYVRKAYLKATASAAPPKSASSGTTYKAGKVVQATKFTYVYKTASTSGKKLLPLGAGNKMDVLKDCGSWVKVKAAGKTGYVRKAYLKAASSTTPPKSASSGTTYKAGKIVQATKFTYVYKTASTSGKKLLPLGVGNKMDVNKDCGSWIKVKAAGKTGYVKEAYLKVAASAPPKSASSGSAKVTASSKTKAAISTSQVSKNVIRVKLTSHSGKKLKVMIAKGSEKVYYNLLPIAGYQSFPLNMGKGTYKVSVLENTSGSSYKYITTKSAKVSGSSNGAYLISTSEIKYSSSMAPIKKAASLTKGKTASQKVKAVYNWVVAQINYDRKKNPPAGYVPSITQTYSSKKGICYDFAALFAAMLRSQGVPTKLVKGYADKVSGYHAWNEVYVNGKWQTIDTSYDAQVGGSMYKKSGYHKTSES
jgi:hypothetical protein